MVELLLLLLPPLLLPWFGPERRAGRTVGRAGGAASFAFGGNGARKLSKACLLAWVVANKTFALCAHHANESSLSGYGPE